MNAPGGETRKPVAVELEVEFEGFSGKERYPDALLYPKGVLLRTRYLKPVGTPARFSVLGQEGAPIGGHGQVVFSRWQDQGPRRPAGLGIRIDGWEGDSEARVSRWFETPSQFDLVDAQAVPAATETPETVRAVEAPPPPAPARAVRHVEPPEPPLAPAVSVVSEAGLPLAESGAHPARWIADDVPPSMPDLSLRFGGGAGKAAPLEPAVPAEPPASHPSESKRPVWQPVADSQTAAAPAGAGASGELSGFQAAPRGPAETMRIPSYSAATGSQPRAGSHLTRQADANSAPPEKFRPVWAPPVEETAASGAETVISASLPRLRYPAPAAPAVPVDEPSVVREGNVVWLPPARPRVTPWILAGVVALVLAGGAYWFYVTRFGPRAAPAMRANEASPPPATQRVEAAPGAVPEAVRPGAAPTSALAPETSPPAAPAAAPAEAPAQVPTQVPSPLRAPAGQDAAPAPVRVVPAQPLSEPARRFSALNGVAWSVEGDELVLRLSLDGAAAARDLSQVRVAGSPPREVVKLRGCRVAVAPRFEVGEVRLRSVRVGEQASGDLHVVLDLGDARVTVAPLTIEGATVVLRLRR